MPPDYFKQRLAELFAEYAAAEEVAKKCETYFGDPVIPAFNELRYAGYHALRAASKDSAADAEVELDKAEKHCHRARYDAAEAGVICCIEYFDEFRDDYRDVTFAETVKGYQEILGRFRAGQKVLAEAKRHEETREQYSDRCETLMDKLIDDLETLDDAREELEKRLADRREAEAETQRNRASASNRFLVATIIGLLGLLVAAASWLAPST